MIFILIYHLLIFNKILVRNKLETTKKERKEGNKSETGPSAGSLKSTALKYGL